MGAAVHSRAEGDPLPPRELVARSLDGQALAIRRALEAIAIPLARNARACVASEIWKPAGFRNAHDFARERYGRSGRWLRDLARLDDAFGRHPALRDAFTGADGGPPIGIVAALLLGRLPGFASLNDWIAHARTVTVRELRRDVRLAGSGPELATAARAETPANRVGGAHRPPAPDPPTEDTSERLWVSISMPAPVRAAFDEALDLHRAICGSTASVSSFIEALVGESRSAPGEDLETPRMGRDVWIGIARRWVRDAFREQRLRIASRGWSDLDVARGADTGAALALRAAADTLDDWRELVSRAGHGSAAKLDATMRGLIEWERVARLRLGQILAALSVEELWPVLQFTGARHYGEQRLGIPERTAADLLRLGRAVPFWEALESAYESGQVSAEKALLLLRMAKHAGPGAMAGSGAWGSLGALRTDRLDAWVRHAAGCTVKRLRDEVRAWARRDLDGYVPRACTPLSTHEWMESIRREAGTATARVARAGLASMEDPSADVFLVLALPADLAADFAAELERWRSRLETQFSDLAARPQGTPSMQAAWACARGGTRRVPAWVGLLAMLEDFVATHDRRGPRRPLPYARALERAGYRCQAPGCTCRGVEAHHIRPRAQGGPDHEDNLIALCAFHHRAGVHGGLVEVSRSGEVDLAWRIGSGLLESWYRNEMLVML